MSLIAAVETGGTKVFAAVADRDDPHTLIETCRITTTDDPERTLGALGDFLAEHHRYRRIEAIGVASFGPLETNPASPQYGWITTTPKPGWQNTDLRRAFTALDEVPAAFVTDVTGSLLGERWQGAATGLDNLAYATVGTGIGVGVMVQGKLVTGHSTPELGHYLVRRHPLDDYIGSCPFHADCLEGLASGPAVLQRWGRSAAGADEIDLLAYYLAQLVSVITLSVAPQRIVLGGGVMKTEGLLAAVQEQAAVLIGGYLGADHPVENPGSDFVVAPQLGDLAGIHGGLELALDLLRTGS